MPMPCHGQHWGTSWGHKDYETLNSSRTVNGQLIEAYRVTSHVLTVAKCLRPRTWNPPRLRDDYPLALTWPIMEPSLPLSAPRDSTVLTMKRACYG